MAVMARLNLAVMVVMVAGSSFKGTSEARARAFLSENPDQAGMNDLKISDPSAFAVVQALLAKQQLGLLDPNHPTASFQDAPAHHPRSFSQEAAENGLTGDSPAQVSEAPASVPVALASRSSNPYPSVSTGIRDPFSFHPQDKDDEMVQSVLGAVDELKSAGHVGHSASSASSSGSSGSLLSSASYTAAQVQQQTQQQLPQHQKPMGPWSFDWGNAYAGTSNRGTPAVQAKVQPEPAPEPQPSSSLLSNRQTTSTEVTGALAADAASLGMEQVILENNKGTIASKDHKALEPPKLDWGNAYTGADQDVAAPPPQAPAKAPMAMNQHNSYLNGGVGKDYEMDLVGSGFHNLATEWQKMKVDTGMDVAKDERIKIDTGASLGQSYQDSLKKARENAWKVALKNTVWGGDRAAKTAMLQNHYLMDLN